MKLAVGSGVAFAGLGDRLFTDPRGTAGRVGWWHRQGAEGIVCYDALPSFYETPLDRFGDLKRVLDDTGLPVAAFNALRKSLHLPELADIDARRLDHCLEVCSVLRPAVVDVSICVPLTAERAAAANRASLPTQPADDETFARVAARLKPVARACAELGAELAIELHDEGIHDDADGCLRLANRIDEPNAGVNPDLGNWYRRPDLPPGTSWRDQLARLAPRTVYWEIKNYRRLTAADGQWIASWPTDLDTGDIDYREAAGVLRRAGFDGWVCHEGGHGDRVYADVKYLAYMRWVLAEGIADGDV
jgi:sugar phosphate isomerase/epimerase